jgi:peptide/nickel transport system substrate-binding protein
MRRTPALIALATTATLLLGACSGSNKPSTSASDPAADKAAAGTDGPHKKGGTVTISNEQGQTWPCAFNPFNPANSAESLGFIYEPLVHVDVVGNSKETPMLATGYQWSADGKSIVFSIRSGVKWSDGQPLTADDVAYTFDIMKRVPATDTYALWTGAGLKSVTAAADKVTFTFNQVAKTYFYNFAGSIGIVPKHIWSTGDAAAKPDTWTDAKPIGSGPMLMNSCGPNNIEYVANPTFWQPDKPSIQKLEYPAYLDNGPANNDLASGKAQWGSQYIPNIKSFYLAKSPNNHAWSPPLLNVGLFPNLDPSHKATSTLAVRQAIATAIDRNQIALIGEGGQQPAANQSGVVTPTFEKYFDQAGLATAGYDKPNADKAKQLLSSAGYTPANPLKLNVISITGYTDWDASLAVIKQQLAPIGIQITVNDLAQQTFDTRLFNGDYDLAYYAEPNSGPSPYYEMRQLMYSKNSAPLGKPAASNYERYNNPQVDALIDQYATADDATQVSIVKQLAAFWLKDIPMIPTTESVDWFQYNTADILGWPTQTNPYAEPSAYRAIDAEQVILHLYSQAAQK